MHRHAIVVPEAITAICFWLKTTILVEFSSVGVPVRCWHH